MNSVRLADPSCLHSRDGVRVDRIIILVTEGSYKGTIAWFTQPAGGARGSAPTAAHYIVSLAGDVCQMVPDDRACYHAGSHTERHWNERSLGIEHEGWTGKTISPDAQHPASARVVAVLCRKFGIPMDRSHIIGHNEVPGATHTDPGSTWPWDRFMGMVTQPTAA